MASAVLDGAVMIQPLRLEIPAELITERLLLRCPRLGDGITMIDAVQASLPELRQWLPWATDDYNVHSAEDWCRRVAARFLTREEAPYLMFDRQTGRHVGGISCFAKGWSVPKFEIGYWLATADTGRGLMTEAVKAVTTMAFDLYQGRRIEIHCETQNHRSRKVAERAGYMLEGILRNECRTRNDQLSDTCIYAVVR
jgi:RimJ/RimL family protein N-acetyltransferase